MISVLESESGILLSQYLYVVFLGDLESESKNFVCNRNWNGIREISLLLELESESDFS